MRMARARIDCAHPSAVTRAQIKMSHDIKANLKEWLDGEIEKIRKVSA